MLPPLTPTLRLRGWGWPSRVPWSIVLPGGSSITQITRTEKGPDAAKHLQIFNGRVSGDVLKDWLDARQADADDSYARFDDDDEKYGGDRIWNDHVRKPLGQRRVD